MQKFKKKLTIEGIKVLSWSSKSIGYACFLLPLLALSACNAPKTLSISEENALLARVKARRECLAARDWPCAYQYFSPAYRQVFSESMVSGRYTQYPNTVLTGMKLGAYDRDAAVASVEVGVMSRSSVVTISADPLVSETLTESWIWSQEGWWFVPE